MTPKPRPTNLVTEEQFLQAVKELAQLQGWLVYHTRDSRGSDQGFPDLTLGRDGLLIFAELKAGKKGYREKQVAWATVLAKVSGLTDGRVKYFLWRPEHWDQIERALERWAG